MENIFYTYFNDSKFQNSSPLQVWLVNLTGKLLLKKDIIPENDLEFLSKKTFKTTAETRDFT
jgi:hypothetical protein